MDQSEKQAEAVKSKDLKEIEQEAAKNRKALNEIPPPGTDPLHEGP